MRKISSWLTNKMTHMAIIYFILALLDIIYTFFIILEGGEELNPLFKDLVDSGSWGHLFASRLIPAGLIYLLSKEEKYRKARIAWSLLFLLTWTGYWVGNGIAQLTYYYLYIK